MLLFVALLHLALDWRRDKAQLLAALALLDAMLGTTQLLAYNRHILQGSWPWFLALLAVAAPLGAAVILIVGALRRDTLYLALPTESSGESDSRIA
jgi:hypothetical protein